MAAEVKNKTLIQNETIILKRECRSKEIFKQLRYLNCLKKEILNSNFYTYYTRCENHEDMYDEVLKERVRYFKQEKGGKKIMCDMMEK